MYFGWIPPNDMLSEKGWSITKENGVFFSFTWDLKKVQTTLYINAKKVN